MPFIGSVSGSRSGRLFPLGGKPAKVGALTLTAGDADDTFTWSAPNANGLPIIKYGYQTTTNNGTSWNAEVEVATASAILNTQYSTSSFKLRVRAFNAAGWGEYSDISTGATVAWIKGDSYPDSYQSQTVSETEACTSTSCGSCGLQARQKTRSKEQRKYRFIRTGSTPGPYDASWTDYTSYPEWSTISCADTGSCVESSWVAPPSLPATIISATDGQTYTRFAETDSNGNATGSYYYYLDAYDDSNPPFGSGGPICGCYEHHSRTLEYCTNSGAYRAVSEGRCRYYRSVNSCGGGGGS